MVNKKYNFLCKLHVIPTPNMQLRMSIYCFHKKADYVQNDQGFFMYNYSPELKKHDKNYFKRSEF